MSEQKVGGRTREEWATLDPLDGVSPIDFAALLDTAFSAEARESVDLKLMVRALAAEVACRRAGGHI